jgi:hypothetical protein
MGLRIMENYTNALRQKITTGNPHRRGVVRRKSPPPPNAVHREMLFEENPFWKLEDRWQPILKKI